MHKVCENVVKCETRRVVTSTLLKQAAGKQPLSAGRLYLWPRSPDPINQLMLRQFNSAENLSVRSSKWKLCLHLGGLKNQSRSLRERRAEGQGGR